jgi:formylglycine-generating enzyme required for sulfatase activity
MKRKTNCFYWKKIFGLLILFLVNNNHSKANNINVSNVSLQNINISAGINSPQNFNEVKFDISWENSWRDTALPSNWDAAWVFVKYRKLPNGPWQHASLNDIGHIVPTGCALNVGLLNPQAPFNGSSNPGKGVFLHRDATGFGNVNYQNVRLRWNYGLDNIEDTSIVEIKVFAIEMVYVPGGGFFVGDNATVGGLGNFGSGSTSIPYLISSEGLINLGGTSINNLNSNTGMFLQDDFNVNTTQILPPAYPKGFNPFYCMKYEISQGQYVDFLNTLSYPQQVSRTAIAPSLQSGSRAMVSSGNSYRSGIIIGTPGSSNGLPAKYACNLDSSQVFNDSTDGSWVACNWLSWADLSSYLDWSSLRPLSDLEFEKSCRGSALPSFNERPWGFSIFEASTQIINNGKNNETVLPLDANANFGNVTGIQGPLRVGVFADSGSTRILSGSSKLGIMELAGNVWERIVTVGNLGGRLYTGLHGDGTLDASGTANVLNWPGISAFGAGGRGGSWFTFDYLGRTSDRFAAAVPDPSRDRSYGGRGVRTVQ